MKSFVCALLLSLVTGIGMAAEPVSVSGDGVTAIGGIDTVAYHSLVRSPQAAAVKGSKDWVVEYKGANWRFASKKSSELFAANPSDYAPSYNGHCANALSLGEGLVATDGTHWEIFGDKLYLFYAARGRERWVNGDWTTFKQDADKAWLSFVK